MRKIHFKIIWGFIVLDFCEQANHTQTQACRYFHTDSVVYKNGFLDVFWVAVVSILHVNFRGPNKRNLPAPVSFSNPGFQIS